MKLSGVHKFSATRQTLFVLAYALFFLGEVLFSSTTLDAVVPEAVLHILEILCKLVFMFCCVMIIFTQKYTQKEFAVVALILTTFAITYYVCGSGRLFCTVLLLLSTKYIDEAAFYRFAIKLILAVILLLALLSVAGIIPMAVRMRKFDADVIRYSMGFTHPNQLGMLSFQIIACYLYLRRQETKIRKFIVATAIAVVVYLITNSGSSFLLSGVLILGLFVLHYHEKLGIMSRQDSKILIVSCLLIAFTFVGVVIVHYWQHPAELTGSLSTFKARFTLSQMYIDAYGIRPFGVPIEGGTSVLLPGHHVRMYAYLDNGYARVLVENGFISFTIMMIALVFYIVRLIRLEKWYNLVIAVCLCLYFFTESKVSTVFFNVFIVNMGTMFFSNLPERKLQRRFLRYIGVAK